MTYPIANIIISYTRHDKKLKSYTILTTDDEDTLEQKKSTVDENNPLCKNVQR
jgi:hypothetical protein